MRLRSPAYPGHAGPGKDYAGLLKSVVAGLKDMIQIEVYCVILRLNARVNYAASLRILICSCERDSVQIYQGSIFKFLEPGQGFLMTQFVHVNNMTQRLGRLFYCTSPNMMERP